MHIAKILKCTCRNDGQDKLHGNGMRVFNEMVKEGHSKNTWRCTVCGKVK